MSNASVKQVSPEWAKELLAMNKDNRPVNEDHVNFLAAQMLAGKWKYTGDPIKISTKGRLLDGQHRLLAVVKSGVTIEAMVIKDLDENIFTVLDTGRVRNAADTLAIEGVDNATKISGIVRFILGMKKGKYSDASTQTGGAGKTKLTNSEVLAFYKKHKAEVLISFGHGFDRNNKLISKSVLSGLHFLFTEKDAKQATYFIERFKDGIGLTADSSLLLLRERLINDINSKAKLPMYEKLALIIKAWQFFRAGKSIKSLKFQRGIEEFPKIL